MAKKNVLLGIAAVVLAGAGVLLLTKKNNGGTTHFWNIGDKIRLQFPGIPIVRVQIDGISWSDTYNQWQYTVYNADTGTSEPPWYLESQIVEWFAGYWT